MAKVKREDAQSKVLEQWFSDSHLYKLGKKSLVGLVLNVDLSLLVPGMGLRKSG